MLYRVAGALFLVLGASPAAAQQDYQITPLPPVLIEVTHGALGAPFFTYTEKATPGALEISVTSNNNVTASGKISTLTPPAVSGTVTGSTLTFATPTRFEVNAAISGARLLNILIGTQLVEFGIATPVLSTLALEQGQQVALLNARVAFRLPITPGSEFNSSEIRFLVQFRYQLSGARQDLGQPAPKGRVPAPKPTDTTFVSDPDKIQFTFGVQCHFRDEGQFSIDIPVARFVGAANQEDLLIDPQTLVKNGVVSKTAKLRVAAWDVDSAPSSGSIREERDVIKLNGYDIGDVAAPSQPAGSGKRAVLSGFDKEWTVTEFEVPIEIVRFGRYSNDFPIRPGVNRVTIDVDTLAAPDQNRWCTTVAWASLSFDAMAPWMLVHGTNAQHTSWDSEPIQGVTFAERLDELKIPYEHFIDLDPNGHSDKNAEQLSSKLREITARMGVKTVHIVAHSKGATDSRMFLWKPLYQPDSPDGFKVLSLFALGTPSKGTVLSDLSVAALQVSITKTVDYVDLGPLGKLPVKVPDLSATANDVDLYNSLLSTAAVDYLMRKKFQFSLGGIPGVLDNIANSGVGPSPDFVLPLAPTSFALEQQTVEGMRQFNARVKKAPGVCYYSLAGNADSNGNFQVTADEAEGMFPVPVSDKTFALLSEVATLTYRNLGRYESVSVVERPGPNGTRSHVVTANVITTDTTKVVPNDLVSPEPSVHCAECGLIKLSTTGNNHSSLKRKETADFILNKINTNFPLGRQALPCAP